jgi:hypothetical protein
MAILILRLALILGLLAAPAQSLHAQAPAGVEEYSLKSVFILNFCRFITWPNSAFSSPSAPLVIGIVGEDPFGRLLESAIRNEKVGGRPIRIERYSQPREIGHPHLLFVGHNYLGNLDAVFSEIKGQSTVTVGEGEAFLDHGGMITFTVERNRVRLAINLERLRTANLNVSSKLLRVAAQ